jgi:hypothetical protein
MLLLVLALVIVAFGLLITAITASAMLWAWVSVGVSAVAAVLLVVDWSRRRRQAAAAEQVDDGYEQAGPLHESVRPEPEQDVEVERGTESGSAAGSEPVAEAEPEPLGEPATPAVAEPSTGDLDLAAEPAEEDTDAADLLTVSELTVEVLVVDERPRYHLGVCRWLSGRPTLAIPVGEARQLGFTPCAVCSPDRTLAAAQRRARATGGAR